MQLPLTPIRFLRYAREQFPEKTGVICRNEQFTYSQFAERCARLATALHTPGPGPGDRFAFLQVAEPCRRLATAPPPAGARHGDRIAFLSTNCHRLLEAYYGVLEASCILLPLNIRLSPEELAFVLNDAEARFLFL